MRDKMRKKYQRALTKRLREMNKAIKDDILWRGRFVIHQMASDWERFADNSGGLLYVILRAYDKESGFYRDYRMVFAPWLHGISWKLNMEIMNNFIVNDIDVWHEEIDPYDNKKDWRNIKVDSAVWKRPYSIYMRAF